MTEVTLPRINLIDLGFEEIETFVSQLSWKRYRAAQIIAWLYRRRLRDVSAMTDLSKADRRLLASRAGISLLRLLDRRKSVDGTEKFLFALEDGKRIETVLIRDGDRRTLCLSSQAGCTLDCRFCLTAQEPLKRNLRAGEIIDQYLTVQGMLPEGERITNVVLMGMGEPLANLVQVTEALRRMISPRGLALSPRRITVSTAGLVPQMEAFWRGPAPVNLSVSLNATTDHVRDRLMPKVNRLYPLKPLLAACRRAALPARRTITFEYVLLAEVNDTPEDAKRLLGLTKGIRCKVNLIRFHPFPGAPYRPSPEARILRFQNLLLQGKLRATLRKSKGEDILAACGQLTGLKVA